MKETLVNGVILNERISKNLSFLQSGYAEAIAKELDNVIGYLLEVVGQECDNPQKLIMLLSTLHNARTEFLGIMPEKKGGAQ